MNAYQTSWLVTASAATLLSVVACSGSNQGVTNTSVNNTPLNNTPIAFPPDFTGTGSIEPQADLDPGQGCDAQYGTAMANALFAALNEGDLNAIRAMFPVSDAMEFTLTPDIVAAAETSLYDADGIQAFNNNEIARVVERFSNLHLVFAQIPPSGTYVDPASGKPVLGVSPVMWRAVGPPLEERGKIAVLGGGKMAIDCETRLFFKVLLSPLSFG